MPEHKHAIWQWRHNTHSHALKMGINNYSSETTTTGARIWITINAWDLNIIFSASWVCGKRQTSLSQPMMTASLPLDGKSIFYQRLHETSVNASGLLRQFFIMLIIFYCISFAFCAQLFQLYAVCCFNIRSFFYFYFGVKSWTTKKIRNNFFIYLCGSSIGESASKKCFC